MIIIDVFTEISQKKYTGEYIMARWKIEGVILTRPFVTIEAPTRAEAEEKFLNDEFDKQEFLDTAFPSSASHIDRSYEEGHEPCN